MRKLFLDSRYYFPVLFSFSLALFLLYDYTQRLLPSLIGVELGEAYHLSIMSYGFLCASFYLLYVPLQLVFGFLIDRYRLTYLIAFSILLCTLGCYLFANAQDFLLALQGRVLMGVGSACIFVSALKMISLRFSAARFTFYFSLVISFCMFNTALLRFLLLFVEAHWGWRLTCYLLAFFGLILVLFNIVDFQPVIRSRDKLIKPQALKQDFLGFVQIIGNKKLWIQSIIAALLYLPVVSFAESWAGSYLQQMGQLSQVAASIDATMVFLGFALGAPLVGWIYSRTRQYQLILTCGAVGVTTLLSIVLYVPDLSNVDYGLFLFLLGIGSASSTVVFSLNRALATKQNAGKVFALTTCVVMLTGLLTWVLGIFLQHIQHSVLAQILANYSISPYQLAFVLLPFASLLAVFLSFYVRAK